MAITIRPATEGRIIVDTPYNKRFVAQAKAAGGRWNDGNRAWIFPAEQTKAVRAILMDVFGETDLDANTVPRVRLRCVFSPPGSSGRWPDTGGAKEVVLGGREVARVFSRDGGAKLGEFVVVVAGRFRSGGSRATPGIFHDDDLVVDLLRLPEPMASRLIASHPLHFRVVTPEGDEIPSTGGSQATPTFRLETSAHPREVGGNALDTEGEHRNER